MNTGKHGNAPSQEHQLRARAKEFVFIGDAIDQFMDNYQFTISDIIRERTIEPIEHERCEEYVDILAQPIVKLWHLVNVSLLVKTPYSTTYRAFSCDLKRDVVVKIARDIQESQREASVLHEFSARGCVKLLDYSKHYGAALLESISPGKPLSSLFPENDHEATNIFCEVVKKLPKEVSDLRKIEPLGDRLKVLERASNTINPQRKRALEISYELMRTSEKAEVLHGDLHHDNILFDQRRGYVAIDPKGIFGEPEYEVAAFMCNPIHRIGEARDLLDLLEKRVLIISTKMAFRKDRIRRWTYVHAAIASVWAEEDRIMNSGFCYLLEFLDKSTFF